MQDTSSKTCRICGTEKPIDDFYYRSDGDRYSSRCKECQIESQRYKRLGVCNTRYEELLTQQGGACAVCKCTLNSSRYTKFAVDHDHKTNKVRGLLCTMCNTAIGLMKDSPKRLLAAVEYLHRHSIPDVEDIV